MPTTSAHGSARDILSGLRAREFVSALILTDDSHGDEVLDAVHAHAAADGLPVVRLSAEPTTGTAASAPRPGDMSALRGLVDQVLASAESITTEQRSALRVAFGIEMGPPPTRLMLCTVIVSLLHAWAGEHPGALLLIDRADRLDPSSADILAPVIRRLRHTGVQAVFSSAPGDTVFDDRLAERIWPDEPLPPPADAENRTARTGVDFDESVVAARAAASDDSASTTALLAPTPAHSPSGLEHAVAEAFSSFAQGHPTGPVYAALLSAVTAHHDHTDRRLVDDAVWLLTFLEQCTGDGARDGLRAVLRSLPNAPVWTRIDGRMQLAESPDAAVDQADRLVDDLAVASDPTTVLRTAFVTRTRHHRFWWRDSLVRVLSDPTATPPTIAAAAALLSTERLTAGDWTVAKDLVARTRQIADGLGYRIPGTEWADHTDALLAAYRGDADAVDVAVYRMSLWDNPSGIFIRGRAAQARAVLALGARAGQRAHRLFGQVAADGNHTALIDSDARMVLDVAQAAVAASATADVAALIERLTGDDKGMPLRRLEPLLRAGALAVLTCRRSDFEQALAVPDADRRPFDLARIRLSYGVMLRSRGDRAAARHELRSAASIFRGLRARPWLAQAEEELRRLGDAPGARATLTDLTPIGLRVAELAASGLSNRQIGELLHLSPSTVGTHLSSVYATLGVTSRAALRDSLGRDAGPGG